MSANGKGDKSRVRDLRRYRANYAAICWKRKERDLCANLAPLLFRCWNRKAKR